jgi:alpha-beta hydrolase superfamily lysophospholipase
MRGYPAKPADYGIVCDEVSFKTRDEVTLRGWFFPSQDTSGIANDIVGRQIPVPPERRPPVRPYPASARRPGPTIVMCGGDAGNMTFLIFYAYSLFTHGFHVFTFDWRGFGESDEWPSDPDQLCLTEFLTDYDAALDHVRARSDVDTSRVGVLGFSTGAYLSFAAAASRDDIAAYAGRALLTSFEDLLSVLAEVDPGRKFHAPPDYPEHLLPIRAAPTVRIPVFLIVGEKDERTPPWMSRAVLERLPGPKDLWIVPGATHGGPTGPELASYPEFFERVAAFFREHL